MQYIGRIYRPPSEAHSLLLQVTLGCSHNRCAFCDMYRDKPFKARSWEDIEADIKLAACTAPQGRRVFLCDGDALVLSTRRLLQILQSIRLHLPQVERVGIYGDTRSVLSKSETELRQLRDAGLGIVYHGVESGDDETLKRIDKGGTADQCRQTAEKLRQAGIKHSVIVLLGIGGADRSVEHAHATARLLTDMDPPFVGALTTTVVPGTPLYEAQQSGAFTLPGKFEMLEELRLLVEGSEFSACRFSSNHASNYLPVQVDLPRDKQSLLALLGEVLAGADERLLKPEFMRGL